MPAVILLDAAFRNLEVLGEASRKIGPDFRAAHPQIPWREMSDLRRFHEWHLLGAGEFHFNRSGRIPKKVATSFLSVPTKEPRRP